MMHGPMKVKKKCVETTLFWKIYGSARGFGVPFS